VAGPQPERVGSEGKVTDFGIARAISSSRTRTGVILGTPDYMSPEQIMDKALAKNLDERFQTAGQIAKPLRLLAIKVAQKQKQRMAEQEAASRA